MERNSLRVLNKFKRQTVINARKHNYYYFKSIKCVFKSKNYIVIYEANKLNSCFYA